MSNGASWLTAMLIACATVTALFGPWTHRARSDTQQSGIWAVSAEQSGNLSVAWRVNAVTGAITVCWFTYQGTVASCKSVTSQQ
jgi:hypothetical protein